NVMTKRTDNMDIKELKQSFGHIFTSLSIDDFLKRPESIITYMKDANIEKPVINIVSSFISLERRRFLLCLIASYDDFITNAEAISSNCMFDKQLSSSILSSIRHYTYKGIDTELIDYAFYGKCRRTMDGTAIYNEELTAILWVDRKIEELMIPDIVITIEQRVFPPDFLNPVGCHLLHVSPYKVDD
ncbi:MAG: hypothetical protein ACI4Q9_04010, partial [Candidatus Methanomethylophilaceae archaeon]